MTELAHNKSDYLGTGSVMKLLFKLALPTMLAQLVNVLYNLVDRMYLGLLPGDSSINALAGLGSCLPIIVIVGAFSALVGMGGAPRVSIKLGEKDIDGAEKVIGNSTTLLVAISVVITAVLLIFTKPIVIAFGATEISAPYAIEYMRIYAIGNILMLLAIGLNPYISGQGFAKTAMISVLLGAVINIGLDPIFIFTLNMGIKGAAIATVLSQAVSAIWVVLFLMSKKPDAKLKLKNLKLNGAIVKSIITLGIAPFIMQASEALVQIALNSGMKTYSPTPELAVASMTIMLSIMQVCSLPMMGFSQGCQPLISYNYGAGNFDRVKKAVKYLIAIALTFSILLYGLCLLTPEIFIRIFTPDANLIKITASSMRIFFIGMVLFGAQNACQTTFLALGQTVMSVSIALLRKIVLLVPLAYILPIWLGINGVYMSEPIADTISVIVAVTLFACNFNKILAKRKAQLDKANGVVNSQSCIKN